MTAPGRDRAELLNGDQVLSHSSSQHTTFKQSKGSDNLYKLLPTLTGGVQAHGVRDSSLVRCCFSSQMALKRKMFTNRPGEEMVYKLKFI